MPGTAELFGDEAKGSGIYSFASSAYFAECDATTTGLEGVKQGIINITVGFAPTKPAEFVVLNIQVAAQSGQG